MSPDTYKCRLNAVNIVVSLINVLVPAIDLVLLGINYKAYVIVFELSNVSLVLSCAILTWGFHKLIKTVESGSDHIVNKGTIFWHIVAYFFILAANIVTIFFTATTYKYEISSCCSLVICLVCSIILALIVNQILSKHLKSKS